MVEWLDASADYIGVLAVTCLGLPVLALIALSLTRRAWREPEMAALLALSWAAALAFVLFASYTTVALSPGCASATSSTSPRCSPPAGRG